jgi:hypothetical protein
MKIKINRAPVLTLWATVVAERLGYDEAAALTLGKGVAGLNAQSKGRRLGIFQEPEESESEKKEEPQPEASQRVNVLGREVPVVHTNQGVRATVKGQPIQPESVRRYLKHKFGEELDEVQSVMKDLAQAYPSKTLEARAYTLYAKFRPKIPEGKKGWGAAGELDLEMIRSLAK